MRLNQVTAPSRDVAKASRFYQALGLELIVDSLPDYVRLACPGDGASTFSIHLDPDKAGCEGAIIYFECEELDATVLRLQAQGVCFERGPVSETWLWREAHLRDPDGNPLRLYHAGENRLHPPWRVGRDKPASQ